MCGRYVLTKPARVIAQHFELFEAPETVQARFNAAPTDRMPVVRRDADGHRRLDPLRWGLIPPWAKELSIGARMINARSETVGSKPAFRDAIRSRRCLIPSDGFYEWKKEGPRRIPYYVGLRDQQLYGAAGIWERWKASDGKWLESFSILTVPCNEIVAPVHDRMPLILSPSDYALWLDPGVRDVALIEHLFVPYPADAMEIHGVSTRVNSVRNDDASLLEPDDPERGKNLELF